MNPMTMFAAVSAGLLALVAAPVAEAPASTTGTPPELVASYDSLATAILAVKQTEVNLVRSILATGYGHAQGALVRARHAITHGDAEAARAAVEELAALVAQLGTEGDNAVAAVRKRLLEGGHHHHADGEAKGTYDPGFVIVTRKAKKDLLDASRDIAKLAAAPDAGALDTAWGKVEAAWKSLMAGSK